MPRALVRSLATLGILWLAAPALAGDPPTETLPPAGRVMEGTPPFAGGVSPYAGYFRANRYDVWQYYAVDRQGHWRPRVAYSPYGSYYLYSGEPYPFAELHLRWWQPSIAGTPYRSAADTPIFDVMPYADD